MGKEKKKRAFEKLERACEKAFQFFFFLFFFFFFERAIIITRYFGIKLVAC